MESTYTEEEALAEFNKLKELVEDHFGWVTIFKDLWFYDDDRCWSMNIEVIKGTPVWSNELEDFVDTIRTDFQFGGECSYEDKSKAGSRYSVHLAEKDW